MTQNDSFNLLSQNDYVQLITLSQQSLYCSTEGQLSQLVAGLGTLFSFENAVCAQARIPDALIAPDAEIDVVDISYPAEYMEQYFNNHLFRTDAVVCEFLTNLAPVNWARVDQRLGYDYPAARLAMDFNMNEGWSFGTLDIASMSCTLFSVGGPRMDNDLRVQKILEYIIPFFSEAYRRVLGRICANKTELTPKEIEVLNWIKEGKNSWEISVILRCSKRTVDFHVNNVKKKLNAYSRAQAVAIGLECGIIRF